MPHITIEYSANLAEHHDIDRLIDAVHATALATGVPALAALRTRAMPREHYRIADGNPENLFVAVIARIRDGRPDEVKQAFMERLMETLSTELAPVSESYPLAISLEVQEIDPKWSMRQNNLHERLAGYDS